MEAPGLAGSWKLQEHIWKWSATLASAALSLLAACLRGQRPESESLSWLGLWSMWLEALLVTMRVLRTQIRNCRMWSDGKCNGLLPLVVLALSRPEKALQWLLFHLLRYSFCGICGNELEGLALIAWGQKSPLLLSHILVCWQKGHFGGCSSLDDSPFLLQSGLYSGICTDRGKTDASLVVLAWETFQKTTLLHSRWHQRRIRNQTKVLVVRN